MVGVPGKSRGCHTCRRRKCDEGRPTCQRCIKSGRDCEGYEKAPVFLNRTPQGLERRRHLDEALMPKDPLNPPMSAGEPMAETSPLPSPSRRPSDSKSESLDQTSRTHSAGGKAREILPRRSSDMDLTTDEIRRTLMKEYFPAIEPLSAPFAEWLLHSLDLDPWGELLETAFLALTMSRLGKLQSSRHMNLQGRLKYGKALNLLQQALHDDTQSTEDQTLAACNVLKYYEVISAFAALQYGRSRGIPWLTGRKVCEATENTVRSYNSHVQGIVRLIIHRGSDRNDSAFARALIHDVRYGAMIAAIDGRRRDPMGHEEWRTGRWSTAIDLEQSLYDHGFEVAALAEDIDQRFRSSTANNCIESLLLRALQIASDLKQWYASAATFSNWQRQWSDPIPTSPKNEHAPGEFEGNPPSVDLNRLQDSLIITDFWVLLISISTIICRLATHLPGSHSTLIEAAAYGSSLQLPLASNIVQQALYQIQSKHGLQASGRAIFSLRAASRPARAYHTKEATQILNKIESAIGWVAKSRGLKHAQVVMEAEQV